jgi:hypothetical protein
MTLPIDTEPVLTQLESALDAGCAVLVALQALPVIPPSNEAGGVQRQIRQMIKLLRGAIDDLRTGCQEEPSLLALGFVLDADPMACGSVQVRPRRTA